MSLFLSKQTLCIENVNEKNSNNRQNENIPMQYKKQKHSKKEIRNYVAFPNSDNIRVCQSQSKGFFFFFLLDLLIAIIWTATFIILLAFEGL